MDLNISPVKASVNVKADATKPLNKVVGVLSGYLGIPLQMLRRLGQTASKTIDLIDENLIQTKLDVKESRELRRAVILGGLKKEHERNLNQIVGKAVSYSASTPLEITSDSVTKDWLNLFFDNAKNVSNEEMQNLWSKILAGEISRPGSFSTRTFDTLRSLDRADAELFVKLARYSFRIPTGGFVIADIGPTRDLDNLYGLTHAAKLSLVEAGLIHESESTIPIHGAKNKEERSKVTYGDYEIVVISKGTENGSVSSSFTTYLPILTFTRAGSELSSFIEHTNDLDKLPMVFRTLRSDGIRFLVRRTGEDEWTELTWTELVDRKKSSKKP